MALKRVQAVLEEPQVSMKAPYAIRWLGMKSAVDAVYRCYESILTVLASDPKGSNLHTFFCGRNTFSLVALMRDIHTELGVLSCNLQKSTLLFSEPPVLIDAVLGSLENLRTQDGKYLAQSKSRLIRSDCGLFYQLGEQQLGTAEHEVSESTSLDEVREHYLKALITNINRRFRKEDRAMFGHFSRVLEPATVSVVTNDESRESVEFLGKFYGREKYTSFDDGESA